MDVPEYMVAMSIHIDHSTLGSGNRFVYWIGGDGVKSLVYDNTGQYNRHTIKNSEFSITKLFGEDGKELEFVASDRLSYRLHPESVWIDAGPLTVAGRRSTDPSFSALKRNGIDAFVQPDDPNNGVGGSGMWSGLEF